MSQDDEPLTPLDVARRVYDLAIAFRRMKEVLSLDDDDTTERLDALDLLTRYTPDYVDSVLVSEETRVVLQKLAQHVDDRRRELERVAREAQELMGEARIMEHMARTSRDEAKVMWASVTDQQLANANAARRNVIIARLLVAAALVSAAGPVISYLIVR